LLALFIVVGTSAAFAFEVTIVPELDGQRLINPTDWQIAKKTMPQEPWNFYGKNTFYHWVEGLKWINSNADGLPLGPELYDRLEQIVMKDHYYAGFETRRILQADRLGNISHETKDSLIARIGAGERVYFSGIDHATLPAKYRWDPVDEFIHNGDNLLPNGKRYMTRSELDAARKNPLFKVNERSLRKIAKNRYTGEVFYPQIKNLRRIVNETLAKGALQLESAKSPSAVLEAVLEMQRRLMTTHRSLDGNGRVIRLLSDLIIQRHGLPPPLAPVESDILASSKRLFSVTAENVAKYAEIKNHYWETSRPPIPDYLYHWTSQGSLEWMNANNPNPGLVPMQTIPDGPWITQGRSGLVGRFGTFAWSNPVASVYGGIKNNGEIEQYGKSGKNGEPPRLLVMKPDPNSRVLVLKTTIGKSNYPAQVIDYSQYDLIFHQTFKRDGSLFYSEWVVLNQKAITAFSANPGKIAPHLTPYLGRLHNPSHHFGTGELHFESMQPHQALPLIEEFMHGGTAGIPKPLLRDLGPAPRCPTVPGVLQAIVGL